MLAHELGHVRNRDILTSSIVASLAGAITLLSKMGYFAALFGGGGGRDDRDRGGMSGLFMLILAPIAATLIQLWISRTREFEANPSQRTRHQSYTRQRAGEAGHLLQAFAHGCISLQRAPVHRGAAVEWG